MLEQCEELFVRVRLAERVLRLSSGHVVGDLRAMLGHEVVMKRGENQAVHASEILGSPASGR